MKTLKIYLIENKDGDRIEETAIHYTMDSAMKELDDMPYYESTTFVIKA